MKTKKFETYSNPYTASTPIYEQISIWLENNPDIKLDSLQIDKREATIYYHEI